MLSARTIPAAVYPYTAFALWALLLAAYLPVLASPLEFPRQILQADLFLSNLILVLTWFFCGRTVFAVFAGFLALLCGYLLLAMEEPGIAVQPIAIGFTYLWLEYLSRQIEHEKLVHQVNREKVQARLNLSQKALEEKGRLMSALERKFERLNELRRFSDRLKALTGLKETAQTILAQVAGLMPHAEQILLYVVDEKLNELGLVAQVAKEPGAGVKEKKGDEYDQWVLRRSQPLLVDDVKSDFRFSAEPGAGFRSLCLVPLVSERKVFGVLHLRAAEPAAFHTDDLRFLDILADMSAVSLRNVLLYEKTKELSIVDSLTECHLFRYVQERLSEEVQRALRGRTPVAVIMADIDHFKNYNDEFGHTAGDTVLKAVAEVLRSSVGSADIVGRYGGEEFVLVLPQKNFKEAFAIAESIRKKAEQKTHDLRRESRKVTLSLGVAVFPEDGTTKEELIWKADKNLYEAKRKGRNRTCGSI